MQKRALLSVSDKTGITELGGGLQALGYEIVSTGGTAAALRQAGVPVTDISEITGFPECLDGRVKTLHPLVHAGILYMRGNPDHQRQAAELGVTPIDIVAVNLYPFRETVAKENVSLAEAIENIDIGGPTMLRAAAKIWQDVIVLADPADYAGILEALRAGGIARETKFALACKVFSHTAAYDAMVTNYLNSQLPGGNPYPEALTLTFEKVQEMRYGENPHQSGVFYRDIPAPAHSLAHAKQLHGRELSFLNINDANGALDMLKEMDPARPCAVAVKHANPCGVGIGDTILEAYQNAFDADPVSIFGGTVAFNRPVDTATAEKISDIFLEILIAPAFSEEALAIITKKKNIRVLELPGLDRPDAADTIDLRKVSGGLLVQFRDTKLYGDTDFTVVTKRAPTPGELEQLDFAWRVVKHVKSNGICLVRGKHTVGIGPGQTNRITAAELAIRCAGDRARGSVMASDAYFPFPDCVKAAAKAGVTAIIQPGGSVNDKESIAACDAAGIAMVFTGMRHFKH